MILVVGATGLLGSEICRLLAAHRQPFRALTRVASDANKVASLKKLGAEIIQGDLKDRASLDAACGGVDTVISTASSTFSRQPGDAIATVDQQGQINLIDAAKAAGIRRFVLISFPPTRTEFPLQTAKRTAEEHLRETGLEYTILQPTYFLEIWWSPALGFDPAKGTARICGDGRNSMTPISYHDVAKFAVSVLKDPSARNATIPLGGADAMTPLEIVAAFEKATGKKFSVEYVPEATLRDQWQSATDPMQKSFAGLMLDFAHATPINTQTAAAKAHVKLTHVKSFVADMVGTK